MHRAESREKKKWACPRLRKQAGKEKRLVLARGSKQAGLHPHGAESHRRKEERGLSSLEEASMRDSVCTERSHAKRKKACPHPRKQVRKEKGLSSPEEASRKRKEEGKRGQRPHGAKPRKGLSSHEDTGQDSEHTGSEKSLSSLEEASRARIRLSSAEE